jgi:hypothetical protein
VSAPDEGVATDDPSELAVPSTGEPVVDDALRGLPELRSTPLAEHHDRLAQAHEALHLTLERSSDEPESG